MTMRVLSVLCLGLWTASLAHVAQAQSVDVYVSSKAGDRLTKKQPLHFESSLAGAADFRIDDSIHYQKIIGFGASFLEAGMICLNSLPPKEQEAVLQSLFDPKTGAGFSAMKTVIGATDFMSAGPFFTYDDGPTDVDLKHFSIARDLGPTGEVTYIKRARKYGTFALQATMDYPPQWMLVDDNPNNTVDPKYYDTLARFYLRYLDEYQKQGIFIDYLSPFNEPSNYTKISYAEYRDLIKTALGPAMIKSGTRTKLQVSENPAGRPFALNKDPIILDDPGARQYVSAISYHGYDYYFKVPMKEMADRRLDNIRPYPATAANGYHLAEFKSLAILHNKYPDLPLWMTEVCHANLPKSWHMSLPIYRFDDGDFWGQQIAADLNAGASGWTYWNMILDQNGGPNLVSLEHVDPVLNIQHPVVIVNRQTKQITYTGLYYYLAHFSKFVRPGAYKIEVSGSLDGLEVLSFKRTDNVIVTEVLNSRDAPSTISLEWEGKRLATTVPAKSISTYLWER